MSRIVTESKASPKRLAQAYARLTITMAAGALKTRYLIVQKLYLPRHIPPQAGKFPVGLLRGGIADEQGPAVAHSAAFSRHVLTRSLTLDAGISTERIGSSGVCPVH
jgi:hypothetical protein